MIFIRIFLQTQLAPQRRLRHSWNILHYITKVVVVQSKKKTMKYVNTCVHVPLKKQSSGCCLHGEII